MKPEYVIGLLILGIFLAVGPFKNASNIKDSISSEDTKEAETVKDILRDVQIPSNRYNDSNAAFIKYRRTKYNPSFGSSPKEDEIRKAKDKYDNCLNRLSYLKEELHTKEFVSSYSKESAEKNEDALKKATDAYNDQVRECNNLLEKWNNLN